jgi:hypothetical protein
LRGSPTSGATGFASIASGAAGGPVLSPGNGLDASIDSLVASDSGAGDESGFIDCSLDGELRFHTKTVDRAEHKVQPDWPDAQGALRLVAPAIEQLTVKTTDSFHRYPFFFECGVESAEFRMKFFECKLTSPKRRTK